MYSSLGDPTAYPHCVRKESTQLKQSQAKLLIPVKSPFQTGKFIFVVRASNHHCPIVFLFLVLSGPPSCLCSKTEECEITGDNELDVVPNITQV